MVESRVVLVTGGGYGIGRGIVQEFASHHEAVVIADLNDERGTLLESSIRVSGGQALFVHADVRVEAQIQALIERTIGAFGRIDVLCNNAGIERYRRPEEYTLDDWNDISETNLRGAFLCTKYAHPFLKERCGCIIHISSVQAFANEGRISAYAATKAGLLGLTRSMALDFASEGIRVNAICPGAIQTGMMEAFLDREADPEEAVQTLGRSIPLGRVGQPADIARVAYFLASPAASYMTGATLIVDGGLLTRLSI
jgi:NAD(P)-dependent dehydrogenase (short-subunit alcohol dehydrogenase family)